MEDFSTALGKPGERCLGYMNEGPFFLTKCEYEEEMFNISKTWWQEYWGDGQSDAVQLAN